MSFSNPVPVAVAVVPCQDGLLGIRRGIEPRKGFVALPGGYVNSGETWQEACCRELFEETGCQCSPEDVTLFAVESGIDSNRILIFGLLPEVKEESLNLNFQNKETQEIVLIKKREELAFPLHTLVALKYFESKKL